MTAFRWTDREVRKALGIQGGSQRPVYEDVSTDTRAIRTGDLFVALVGERFDGHAFLAEAARDGARGAIVREDRAEEAGSVGLVAYAVPDTLVALGALARHRRRALAARVVGITGSSGKTTTKELAKGAIGGALRTHATTANLNNRIGLPLTLLSAPADAEVVLLEMGTNEPGEIATLTDVAEPSLGVVTTVGEAHLEGLGSLAGVLHEKLALVRGLPAHGVALVGDEPPELAAAARATGRAVRVAGWSPRADQDLRPDDAAVDDQGCFGWTWKGEPVRLRIPGRAAVVDALLALALSEELGVEPRVATSGLGSVEPTGMRGEMRAIGTLRVLVDCYNANPQSVEAALDLLEMLPHAGGKVAVLGSMLELGDRSGALHEQVLGSALARRLDRVIATGAFASAAPERTDERLVRVEDPEALVTRVSSLLKGDELVLLKGSRGVRLERLLQPLRAAFGGEA
ncbi:MAG: UDP-N-acetylmuramoyl-tripeptide--D-alanyl-D-alanine ligase [Gemmatimonadota bacterium]